MKVDFLFKILSERLKKGCLNFQEMKI